MNRIALMALGIVLAASVAWTWVYYAGNETDSRPRYAPSTLAPGDSNPAAQTSGGLPETPDVERGVSGAGSKPERPLRSPFGDPAPAPSSPAVVENVERPPPVAEEPPAQPEPVQAADQDQAPPETDVLLGDLVISGRVLTHTGNPVSGIELTATAAQVFDRDKGELVNALGSHRKTTSAYDGSYEFGQLAAGEYEITAGATQQYSRARISVRAGVDFADLILHGRWDLRVEGTVSDIFGEPLEGVKVQPTIRQPVTHRGRAVSTDEDGRYLIVENVMENAHTLLIHAAKSGYEKQKISVDMDDIDLSQTLEYNIVMERDPTVVMATVRGTLRGPEDEPVGGQRIDMSSARTSQRYRATTDAEGDFVLREVEVAGDYMLSINAADAYQDHIQKNLKVPRDGLELRIDLKAANVGTLTGQMVDVYGNPVPHLSLVLQTRETSFYHARVVGDGVGAFRVEGAPAGELRFRTNSNPYHRVDGIQLATGAEERVTVILDSGHEELRGHVVDDNGNPVAVPHIGLTWSHDNNGLRSSSRRTTAAGAQGDFRFTQLGPGSHTITMTVPSFKPVRFAHEVGKQSPDIMVRLEPQ